MIDPERPLSGTLAAAWADLDESLRELGRELQRATEPILSRFVSFLDKALTSRHRSD